MSGCLAPELAAGEVSSVIETLWQESMAKVASYALSPAESEQLVSDLATLKGRLTVALQSKLDYLRRLPWLIAGVAVLDENRAREVACRAVAAYDREPEQALHHRRTVQLMQRESPFRRALDLFIAGHPRAGMPAHFLATLGEFRCMPVIETTIEGRHARIAKRSKLQSVGPVKVSLENRMPLLERSLQQHLDKVSCCSYSHILM